MLEGRIKALGIHHGRVDQRVDLFRASHLFARQHQPVAPDHQLLRGPEGKGAVPALIVDGVQCLVKLRQTRLGRLHLEGADQAQGFVIAGPCQCDRIGPPLPLNRHGDLVLTDAVKIPVVIFGDIFDDVDGVNVIFKVMLG